MTRPTPDTTEAALAPVRAELLRVAGADARDLLDRADREAEEMIRRAQAEAEAIVDQARRKGEEIGAKTAQAVLAQARRSARQRELAARRAVYDELRGRVTQHVRDLRRSTGYATVLDRIGARARSILGADCEVLEHPQGGAVASSANRRVDLTLDALAAHVMARLGLEAERLWKP